MKCFNQHPSIHCQTRAMTAIHQFFDSWLAHDDRWYCVSDRVRFCEFILWDKLNLFWELKTSVEWGSSMNFSNEHILSFSFHSYIHAFFTFVDDSDITIYGRKMFLHSQSTPSVENKLYLVTFFSTAFFEKRNI